MARNLITKTFSLNTDSHADGDVVAAVEELADWSVENGAGTILESLVLVDIADKGADLDLIFLNASGSIGAESAAFAMADAVAATVIGFLNVPAAAYVCDGTNNQVAVVTGINQIMHPAAGTTSIWCGIIADAAVQYATASDITIKFGRRHL